MNIPDAPEPADWLPLPAAGYTTGCVSIGKTGSMALTAAMHEAGFPDACHLHYLGPTALKHKPAGSEPMREIAAEVAGRIADHRHRFAFVTCVRDPIARLLSQAFYRQAKRPDPIDDPTRDRDALVRWWEAGFARDITTEWFDDTFGATFGFDLRVHRFDHTHASLRYRSDRLRLVVLRTEDPPAAREAALGWLLGREQVSIPIVNTADSEGYAERYRRFVATFKAPPSWLETLYDTEAMRLFYTPQERERMRDRWR